MQTDLNTVAAVPPSPVLKPSQEPEVIAGASIWSCDVAGCSVHVVASCHHIDPDIWRNAFSSETKDCRYYEVVEDTLRDQFDQRYFVIRDASSGITGVQPFFFVEQDVLAGLPMRFRNAVAAIRKYRPHFLKLKMLTVGCPAGEGQVDRANPAILAALHESLERYARHERAPVILLKDYHRKHRDPLAVFTANSYARVPSMPGGRLAIEFDSFEDYMQRKLGKTFRKNLRRKFKDAAAFPPVTMEVVSDVTPFVEEIYPLYLQTYYRSDYRFEQLTKEYLCVIGRHIPERTRYFLWRQEGRIIAFALCLVNGDTLCDMNVGLDYSVALDMHLYFLTFRDIVQWAIENGLKNYTTGPLNYDPKLHLRLELDPLDLYARHSSRWINPLLKFAFKYLQPARHDRVIPRFSNAHEMY